MKNKIKKCVECKKFKNVHEFYKNKSRKDGMSAQCIVCNKQRKIKDKEKIKDWGILYRSKNKKLISEKRKKQIKMQRYIKVRNKYISDNLEKIRKYCKIKSKKERDNLSDNYIKQLIINKTCLKHNNIPEELVRVYRELIKLKREIKNGRPSKYG